MFDGKVAVITGSSYGIGKCTAVMFAKQRCRIVLCGRNALRLTSVLQECLDASGGHSERFLVVKGDITEAAVRKRMIQQAVDVFGRLDILVNSAGMSPDDPTQNKFTEDDFDLCMDVNLKAVYFSILEAAPHLEKTGGCIVNMSSSLSVLKSPEDIVEGMAKAGVDYLTRSFGLSLFAKGIRVNAVLPTLALNNTSGFDWWDKFAQEYGPLHPLYGRNSTLEEQANVVLFLASPEASCISGECLLVDGGITLIGPT
ncbi:3-oxoacyl-[acyl-carrier-protein] reductase FabG-like [Biomphalaria glabrata]|uniref:3-oxoacyl-[acyl-carrier-protein] reductase FabG-like n=1 Tax=Biomphalaria glabrata TaxID=6526 RepID=A0A9W3BHY4_BIOGL|nr:3-oxoacyl-[acyl-carrier-protein] reductase FabG-like [Biomphalaria glabrata]XP_055899045.1 3-oxoacyl-[acyl-carrier-protein] reductase FabG-like [Biomphalaria glabrata]XP_055899046.1 3-oxoacyl-[acyl-carrier-protein] reductase FabG-like [Biomphalaria glabrata]